MRLFWALPWPDSEALRGVQHSLRARGIEGRWVDPELAHLTLVFLGEVDTALLGAIRAAGEGVAKAQAQLRLRTASFGAFPRASAARNVWWGLEACPGLAGLAHRLQEAMEPFAKLEKRTFQPHLTLARFPKTTRLPELGEAPPLSWAADSMILYRSHIGRSVHHERLFEMTFGRDPEVPERVKS